MQEILGYFGAMLIGVSLGLIGGGGSILTVPVLVYLMGISPVMSTAYSLFIVGTTALAGAIQSFRTKDLELKTGIIFAIPAFIAVYLTRKYLIPAVPESLFHIGDLEITKNIAIMIFFALIMLGSAYSMIRSGKKKVNAQQEPDEPIQYNYPLILLEGAIVGLVTGLVGAGGGFLIVPALVLLARLPMKLAVGTSLMIISAKSLIGFLGDVFERTIDWPFLLLFSAIAIGGLFLGSYARNFISGEKLKAGFGWFVLVMAIYIIINETILTF